MLGKTLKLFLLSIELILHGAWSAEVNEPPGGGATLVIQWTYSNPDSMLDDGRTCDRFSNRHCDVYFTLCLRSAETSSNELPADRCSLLGITTSTYDNAINLYFTESRAVKTTIPAPISNWYTFELKALDEDFLPNYELIGTFLAEKFSLLPTGTFTSIPIKNVNLRSRNKRLTLTVEMSLTCAEFYYGDQCTVECRPDPQRYVCNSDGRRICNPGLTGALCNMEDSCFYEKCAPHANCKNREDGTGRVCVCNGRESPDCYPGYDPCSSNPCAHDGRCQAIGKYGESFHCECTQFWTGHRCTERRLACAEAVDALINQRALIYNETVNSTNSVEVCLNGGKCLEYSDRLAYHCVCLKEWTGEHCETRVMEQRHPHTVLFAMVLSVGSLLVVVVSLLTIGLLYKWHKSKQAVTRHGGIIYYHPDRNSTATVASLIPTHPNHSNDLYGSTAITDKFRGFLSPAEDLKGKRNFNNVYDECDPLGLDSKNGAYSTTFDQKDSVQKNSHTSSQGGQDDPAPPLPERPKDLGLMTTHQPSIVSFAASETATQYTWGSFRNNPEGRQPTVYRPVSPTYTPSTLGRRTVPNISF